MANEEERAKRKQLTHSLRDKNRQRVRDELPAPILVLKELFNFLDQQLSSDACDHTFRFTRQFIERNVLNEDRLMDWSRENGGHCDCEMLNNVEQIVEEAVPGYDRIRAGTDGVN